MGPTLEEETRGDSFRRFALGQGTGGEEAEARSTASKEEVRYTWRRATQPKEDGNGEVDSGFVPGAKVRTDFSGLKVTAETGILDPPTYRHISLMWRKN